MDSIRCQTKKLFTPWREREREDEGEKSKAIDDEDSGLEVRPHLRQCRKEEENKRER